MLFLSPFLDIETAFAFFNLEGDLPEHKKIQKIISRALNLEIFNMRMLIMCWT